MKDIIGIFSNRRFLVAALAFCVLGAGVFAAVDFYFLDNRTIQRECDSYYRYINPEPDCEVYNEKMEKMNTLQKNLEEFIAKEKNEGKTTKVGVFVRDLTTRRFVGVDDTTTFVMASLLKVPLAIAYYKQAEITPDILRYTVSYAGTPDLYDAQAVVPREKLVRGESYTFEQLIRRALIYSDNTAAEILYEKIPKDFLDDVMRALGLAYDRPGGDTEYIVAPRTYANVFRVLYNSSYLTREYSDAVLSLLAEADYNNGARGKLPRSVVVADKFGERTEYSDTTHTKVLYRQLHDCGIVYGAGNLKEPYSFCIMTEGSDFTALQESIQNISLLVYRALKG